MIALIVSVAIALLPHGAAKEQAQHHVTGALPSRGILVFADNLAGVKLGHPDTKVKALWGSPTRVCTTYPCTDPTWIYIYPKGQPVGAAVRFKNKKVIAVFTLGAVPGWKSSEGITIADPVSRVYDLYPNPKYTKCIGFEALSIPRPGVTTSFYLTSGVIYGFALTVPGLNVCQ